MNVAFVRNETIIFQGGQFELKDVISKYPTGEIAILGYNFLSSEKTENSCARKPLPEDLEAIRVSSDESIQLCYDFINSFFKSGKYENFSSYVYHSRGTFAHYGNGIIKVLEINSLYELMILDFLHCFIGDSSKRLCICQGCGRLFRKTQKNKIYCCSSCKTRSIHSRNMESPYYAAYHYMEQYLRRCIRSIENSERCTFQSKCAIEQSYKKWHSLAKNMMETLNKNTFGKTLPSEEYSRIRQEFKLRLFKIWDYCQSEEKKHHA